MKDPTTPISEDAIVITLESNAVLHISDILCNSEEGVTQLLSAMFLSKFTTPKHSYRNYYTREVKLTTNEINAIIKVLRDNIEDRQHNAYMPKNDRRRLLEHFKDAAISAAHDANIAIKFDNIFMINYKIMDEVLETMNHGIPLDKLNKRMPFIAPRILNEKYSDVYELGAILYHEPDKAVAIRCNSLTHCRKLLNELQTKGEIDASRLMGRYVSSNWFYGAGAFEDLI